jgi:hypothetical protein
MFAYGSPYCAAFSRKKRVPSRTISSPLMPSERHMHVAPIRSGLTDANDSITNGPV